MREPATAMAHTAFLAPALALALAIPASASVFNDLEQGIRQSVDANRAEIRRFAVDVDPGRSQGLNAIIENQAKIESQVSQLAAEGQIAEAKKDVFTAGFFVSLSANVLTGLGLLMQFRGSKLDRTLRRIEIEKATIELTELRRKTQPNTA